jgi:BirA family biotin operon repressor/biotin-[acetyl-CoA-carboxylase] ligase
VPEGLAPQRVLPRLRGRFGRPYTYVVECPSTQRLLGPDAPEGAVAVAEHQTEGRGRLGRSWIDAPRGSLLFSLCLRPAVSTEHWAELTPIAGRAAADAIATMSGTRPEIKPPNDLLLDGRKVAGILAEAAGERVVLGIGINVGGAAWPDAGSVDRDRRELLVDVLDRLERGYDEWLRAST